MTQTANQDPQWDVPGWDWSPNDHTWMHAGVSVNGTSIFFIHGGRIRHQADIPYGRYTVDEFVALIRERAEGLDEPCVDWCQDTGGGDTALWVEGTRAPNEQDLARLHEARARQERKDAAEARSLRKRHPDWFASETP